jgi:nitrogen regulatory protein PII
MQQSRQTGSGTLAFSISTVRFVKKIEAIIRPFKLEEVRNALTGLGVHGMTISDVEGCGRQSGRRSHSLALDFSQKMKLEIVVDNALCNAVFDAIITGAKTGKMGDGRIFISQLDEAIRIRTQETGQLAIC